MRKKLLMLLLVLCTGINLYACGSKGSEVNQNNAELQTETIETEKSDTEDDSGERSSVEDDTEESIAENTEAETDVDDVSDPGTETKVNTESNNTQKVTDSHHGRSENKSIDSENIDKKPSGLIILEADEEMFGIGRANVTSINPENGEQKIIFSISVNPPADCTYLPPSTHYYYTTHRHWLSQDYTKIAVSKLFTSNLESHAGWLDENGDFFDVTEALGLSSQGDFAEPVNYEAIGFTEDGYFAYCETIREDSYKVSNNDYYVPVSDISSKNIANGSPFPHGKPHESLGDYYGDFYQEYNITDWIDSSTLIRDWISNGEEHYSEILNWKTGESKEYIPGDSRENWNGVLSPDGSQIAFMSKRESGDEPVSIYTVPISGGEPTKIDCNIAFSNARECFKWSSDNIDGGPNLCAALIDWQ